MSEASLSKGHTIKFEFMSMTTRCSVQLVHDNETHINKVAKQIYDNTKRLERTYNFFAPDSWLTQALNQRRTTHVPLTDEAWEIFSQIHLLSQQTAEVFDVTVGTLKVPPALLNVDNERSNNRDQTLYSSDAHINALQTAYLNGASREQLAARYRQALGLKAWTLESSTKSIVCTHTATRFDLGGVVKEYAVDAAIQIVKKASCGALISFGGDLRVVGKKATGADYKVGIKNPFNPEQTVLSVPLIDEALTTSGNYERQDQVGEHKQSHLIASLQAQAQTIKPSTTQQAQADRQTVLVSDPASVTVISQSTLTSGVFSTALMLQPNLSLPPPSQSGILKVIIIDSTAKLHAKSNEHLK